MRLEQFGTMADGEPVQQVQLAAGGLSAAIISYGAALQQLYLDGCDYSLVLGFNDFASYQRYSQHYGANCGRVANRIAGARLHLAGRDYQLDNNFLGKHCLHGGKYGYSKRNWNLLDCGDNYARLELVDSDGCGGFPGTVRVRCEYRLSAPATLQLTLSAEAQADTVCNLAHHSYFCLDASGDIRDHRFSIAADSYLPVDSDLIPTGAVAPVVGTDYDLRQARSLRAAIAAGVVYDHNYCLADKRRQLSEVAQVSSANSGISLRLASTEPGLQFYAGNNIDSVVAGVNGAIYRPFSGFCLEPQLWPAANSHPHFPSIELRAGERYEQISSFSFQLS